MPPTFLVLQSKQEWKEGIEGAGEVAADLAVEGVATLAGAAAAKAALKAADKANELRKQSKTLQRGVTQIQFGPVDFPGIGEKISQKQNRHIAGRPEYRTGGYLDSFGDAQNVLDAYHSGNAMIIGKSSQGFPIVRYNDVTGTNVNIAAGFPSQPTNVFMIKGTQSPSVVPINPNWTPR